MKISVLIVLILILCTSIQAYVMPEYYQGIQIKFYDEVNKTECYEMFDTIPSRYFDKMNYIKIYDSEERKANGRYYFTVFETVWAYYHITGGISMFNGCNKATFIHELAHHCQIERKDSAYLAIQHKGQFNECRREIWNNTTTKP